MKKFFFTIICSLFTMFAFAQSASDRIIKIDGSEILCHVKEIGQYEIKYTKAENPDGPIYVIPKSDVRKIVFANGTEEIIAQNEFSVMPKKHLRNYKKAITTRPMGPLFGFVCVGYQQAITPTRAVVAEIGFIGVGYDLLEQDPAGGYARFGYRMKRAPEIVMQGMEWGYALGGWYFQPEVVFSSFSRQYTDVTSSGQYSYTYTEKTGQFYSGALLMGIGRQMIVGDIVTIDIGYAFGYGFSDGPKNSLGEVVDLPNYFYSHTVGGRSFPFASKITFSVGILMK